MRHYAHHIGDYRTRTAHLSLLEDGAYRRLLDLYYMHERPLPADIAAIQRLCVARADDERAAVETVLREFFRLQDDGWHNSRADEEIATYQARADAGRKNGHLGGRPLGANRTETGQEPDPNRRRTVTNNHEPRTNGSGARARKTRMPEDFGFTDERAEYAKAQGCTDPADTFNRFKLHHASKGTLMADWDKAWQYWCRNEKNFSRPTPTRFSSTSGNAGATPTIQHDTEDQWRGRIRGWRPGKFWHRSDWGPEPGQPGCRVPKPILADWESTKTGTHAEQEAA